MMDPQDRDEELGLAPDVPQDTGAGEDHHPAVTEIDDDDDDSPEDVADAPDPENAEG